MDKLILKYLIIKMTLGMGYSIDYKELSNLETYLFNRNIKYKEEYDDRYIDFKDNIFTAKYNLNRDVLDIFTINNKEHDLLKTFIKKNSKVYDYLDYPINKENLQRCKELIIYLIEVLNNIKLNKKDTLLEELNNYEIDIKLLPIFTDLSMIISYLLTNDKDLVICNYDISNNKSASYKAYNNYIYIDKSLNKILSKLTKKNKYTIYMNFANNTYYSIPSYKQDMLVVNKDYSIYGPIYIPRVNNADDKILEYKSKCIKEANDKILRLEKGFTN